jgi:mono/diheme cytochrome c family protein
LRAFPIILMVGFLPIVAPAQTGPGGSAAPRDLNALAREVGTILGNRCVVCHGPEQKKGGLDLTRRSTALAGGKSGNAIVPGDPDASMVVDKVTEGEMPPKGALSHQEIAAVRAWVEAGATYASEPLVARRAVADWWSLRPIRNVLPPHFSGADAAWIKSPVDAFILGGLNSRGLSPAPEAEPAALIRRLTFDLTGLPPTTEEVDAFVADKNPHAYEQLVDRLLASPHYGERWGRHWLDVVRFGESQGYETNLPRPSAWPYRDYIIRAFNRDTPFPQFVFEQLAADTILAVRAPIFDDTSSHTERGDAEAMVDWLTQAATGFLVGGTHDIVGNQTVEGMLQQRADDLDDMITATGTAFLGLTIQCARCHDHKFDPILHTDYYGLQAIFAGVNHAEREVAAPDAERRRQEAAAVAMELAVIEGRLDGRQPLARPGQDTPARPMVNARRNVERFGPVSARMIRLTILATNDKSEPCLDEVEVYSAATAGGPPARNVGAATAGASASASSEYPDSALHKVAHLNDGRLGNSRSWISRVPGKGSVTVEWPAPATIDRVIWGRDREEVYRDRLATEYYLEAALETGKWQVVASSRDRIPYTPAMATRTGGPATGRSSETDRELAELIARQAKLRARLSELGPTVKLYAGTFTAPGPTHLLIRGDPTRPGSEVRPAALRSVAPALVLDAKTTESERRKALARWIADPANPLPARVMVNRVWQYHFGRGIVSTPSDFGYNGAAPSHPQLLDWLASKYIADGWRLKPLHRLIVTSAVYRQSNLRDDKALGIDRNNLLLWRMAPRRLEAESIRDAILAASGRLDTRMGGPGYNVWEPNSNYVAVYKPRGELGPDTFRRMVYQFKPRSQPDPTFGAFDCPDAALVAPRRNVSTTALQALNLLNSRFILQQATHFAERLEREAGPDRSRQAERGFALAFGRPPSSIERDAAVSLIASHGAAAFCRALYNANEFVYVP